MKRIYEEAAYGPQGACFWADTVTDDPWPTLTGDHKTQVAIIGGGFTGMSAALHLAKAGVSVTVLEAEHPGWGASGRNGGFCCLGSAMVSDNYLQKRFGPTAAQDWANTEKSAVSLVDQMIRDHGWDVDRHSHGETRLAHKPSSWRAMQREADEMAIKYGIAPRLHTPEDLKTKGFGGDWHGGMTMPFGFAVNPRKYLRGLATAAKEADADLFAFTPAQSLTQQGNWSISTPKGRVLADQVIIATNGYAAEDLPDWLRGRYLPLQSSVIVTRPLTQSELQDQGWWSDQMSYDSRQLLHYFRKLPDDRFLFGMRGGLTAKPSEARKVSARIRRDFHRLFPKWSHVEITHEWAGLVCMMGNLMPYVGPVPDQNGLSVAMGYHGNGVAMGSYAGALIAGQISGKMVIPDMLQQQPSRFPLGKYRRNLLRPAYLAAEILDL